MIFTNETSGGIAKLFIAFIFISIFSYTINTVNLPKYVCNIIYAINLIGPPNLYVFNFPEITCTVKKVKQSQNFSLWAPKPNGNSKIILR